MKKLLLLFSALLIGVSGAWADVFNPSGRASTLQVSDATSTTKYMIRNTATRWFLRDNNGAYATTVNTDPLNFQTSNESYLWVLEEGDVAGTYKIKNYSTGRYAAGGTTLGSTAVDYTIADFSTCPSKGGMASYNDDGTQTAAASITSADNTVYIVPYGAEGDVYWNNSGTSDFGLFNKAHVFVLYEVANLTELKSDAETLLADNVFSLQSLYGVTSSDKITSAYSDASEGNIPALIDNNYESFHHSDWHGNVGDGAHSIVYELTTAAEDIYFYIKQRNSANPGRPRNITVSASNDGSVFEEIATLSDMPWVGSPLNYFSTKVSSTTAYKYWKFTVNSTYSGTSATSTASNRWFCASEWYVLPANTTVETFFDAAEELRTAESTYAGMTAAVNTVTLAKQTLDEDIAAHTKYAITFRILDTDNNVLGTSSVEYYGGTELTSFPASLHHDMFYDYTSVNEVVSANKTIDITATLKDSPVFRFTEDDSAPVWYLLKLKNQSYVNYTAGATPNVALPTSALEENPRYHWAFIGNPYTGFTIINQAAGTSLVLGSASAAGDGNDGGNTYATLGEKASQTYEKWFVDSSSSQTNGFYIGNAAGQYLNHRSTANLAYWASNRDAGSTFTVTIAPDADEVYAALIAQLKAKTYGTGFGKYTLTGEFEGYESQAATIISGFESQGYSEANIAVVRAMISASSYNQPAGKYIRMYNAARNVYIGSAASGKHPNASSAEEAGIYYVTSDNKMISYNQGLYLQNAAGIPCVTSTAPNPGTFSFSDAGDGKYYVYCGGYLVAWTSVSDRLSSPNEYAVFTLEEVTDLPVSLTNTSSYGVDGYYSTLYFPVAVSVNGADVYAAKLNSDGTELDMVKIEDGIVPAETGVIVQSASVAEPVVTVTTTTNTVESDLTGCIATTDAVENSYVFSIANDRLGFYKFAGSTLKANRAYYVPETTGDVRGYVLNFGGTPTGISNIGASNGAQVYDLQGRRVTGAQKGLYIINGKKVVK